MNARRRKILDQVGRYLDLAADQLSDVIDEEQDCLDNTPDNLQEADSYVQREACLDLLIDAADEIQSAKESIVEALNSV